MKKHLAVVAVLLVFLTALFSCGGKAEAEKTRVDHVFTVTETALPDGFTPVSVFESADGRIDVFGRYEEKEPSVISFDEAMKIVSETSVPAVDGGYVDNLSPLYISDGYAASVVGEDGAFLVRYSGGGYETVADLGDYFPDKTVMTGLCVSSDGKIFISSEKTVAVFDADMKLLFTADAEGRISRLYRTSDGRIFVGIRSDNGITAFRAVDVDGRRVGESIPLPDGVDIQTTRFFVGGGHELYYDTPTDIYAFDGGSGGESSASELLCDYINSDIVRSEVRELLML